MAELLFVVLLLGAALIVRGMAMAQRRVDFAIHDNTSGGANIKVDAPVRPPTFEAPVTHEDMARIKAAAEAAMRSKRRSGAGMGNPYKPGTRRHVVWETYLLEAELSAEWWSQLTFSRGDR